ncbi:MAG TPA: hypothetical protein DCQ84_04495 [Candidatus Competibacteraceae bacterium]|nr:hypothetical protein [Candidatus Competibacteraceae bacterium]
MMTLRTAFQSDHPGSRHRDGQPSVSLSTQADDKPTAAEPCPRCQRRLTSHHFATDDGLSIITYHCIEHGDVIPARDLTAHHHR